MDFRKHELWVFIKERLAWGNEKGVIISRTQAGIAIDGPDSSAAIDTRL
jgi:hypothetical protein